MDIIVITFCAVICGADDWTDVVNCAKAKKEWLKKFLELRHGIPSHDTKRFAEAVRDHWCIENQLHYIRAIVRMGFYSGMRRGEILDLTWDKVNLEKRVIKLEAQDTKNREPRTIPVSQELLHILKPVPKALHDNHVFIYKERAVQSIKAGLFRACRDAQIDYGRFSKSGSIFHDLRHCFNTSMRRAGVAESVIMSITGHSTRTMFAGYNTIDAEDAQNVVAQLGSYLDRISTNVDKQGSQE